MDSSSRSLLLCLGLAVGIAGCSSGDARPDASDGAEAGADAAVPSDAGGGADTGTRPRDAGAEPACPSPATPLAFTRTARAAHPLDAVLRLNHLQAEATHNSYHLQTSDDSGEWSYSHAPLGTQLAEQGVRGVELDVHWDRRCERFEVFHLGLLDEGTTCRSFADCLTQLRDFSIGHPGHHPIFVHLEPKDGAASLDEARFVALERELLEVFDRSWIITPDEVRGGEPTLPEGLAAHGWPALAETRGRLLFYLDDSGAPREVYTHGGRDLDGRLMFVDSELDSPYAAVLVLNDPIGDAATIATALERGYLVRTRADSSPPAARRNDRVQLEAALASGAQIVTTDYPAPVPGTDYWVEIPGGTPSRCSPVTAPPECTSSAIESPALLDAR